MRKKIRLGILFGGRSAEHEVSLQSARNVLEALDKDKYDVTLIGIDKEGRWHLNDRSNFLLNENNPKLIKLNRSSGPEREVALVPGKSERQLIVLGQQSSSFAELDVVFPLLHGSFGEDGTVQGFLKLANVPFVGAGVLGSAVGMDKDVMKRLLRDAGIPLARFLVYDRSSAGRIAFSEVAVALGAPFFVKPANLGSSVGIAKVYKESELHDAAEKAFAYDHKILIEEYIQGRELECSVLGNWDPIASVPGEIEVKMDFYSYDAKYINEQGASLVIPARIPDDVRIKVQQLAVKTFKVLCCEGMARVDFFLKGNGDVLVNEINTIPGFTKNSMYPKLWEASGLSYAELIDRLIELALQRSGHDRKLRTSIES